MSGASSEANAEPNLTPMLDMVFQLITFFMLVINFKTASMDMTLKLPVVGSAKMVNTGGAVELVVLNIDDKGRLRVYGQEKPDIEKYIQTEANASLHAINDKTGSSMKFGDELPAMIVVRADEHTPFKMLNRVIKACQDSGFRKFALKAMNKVEGA